MLPEEQISPELNDLLRSIRKQIRRFVVMDAFLAILGLFSAAFWLGYLIDYTPVRFGGTEMPHLARLLFLCVSAAMLCVLVAKSLIGRLKRPLPDASLALLIERLHPELGGRLTTAVELLGSDREIEDYSQSLLAQVHQQARSLITGVDRNRLFRRETLVRKSLVTGPLLAATLGLLLFDPTTFALAAKRLTLLSDNPWPRRADITMVGIELPAVLASGDLSEKTELIEFEEQVARLPVGSSSTLRIKADATAAELPNLCTVYYQTDSGGRGQSNMRRVGRIVDGFQHFVLDGPPLTDLNESLTLSVRGLDDRIDDYRIEAVTPPTISETMISVSYPSYLKQGSGDRMDWARPYQTGIRVEEGSDVELTIQSTSELGSLDLWIQSSLNQGESRPMKIASDGLSATLNLDKFQVPATVSIVPKDISDISAQAPYRYFIGVIKDEPPAIRMTLQGIGNAVTANAKIPLTTEISDDYGAYQSAIALEPSVDLELEPRATKPDGAQEDKPGETPTDPTNDAAPRTTKLPLPDGSGKTELIADLRELVAANQIPELTPGKQIDLLGETNDRYDLGVSHVSRTEVVRLPIVTPEQLLALLERRELALRSRLEQTLDESRKLRDNLQQFAKPQNLEPTQTETESAENRQTQVRKLRVQQAILQLEKTKEELAGIATSLDDILLEMQNNRVDSVDRQNRLGKGVRDPIQNVIDTTLEELQRNLKTLSQVVDDSIKMQEPAMTAVSKCEDLILELTAILDKMLDLESYNEILDLVRGLIDDQTELMEDTKSERKKKVLDLFK